MSRENIEVVKRAIAALNERDIDRYLACCTEDFELRTPMEPIGGVYEGADAVRRFFADLEDTSPDFRLHLERMEPLGEDQVLAFLRITATGRASGIATGADLGATGEPPGMPTTNVYDFVNGKIRRIRIFLDRQEALEAVGLQE
jgi:ketosteroid isomerase-like protein